MIDAFQGTQGTALVDISHTYLGMLLQILRSDWICQTRYVCYIITICYDLGNSFGSVHNV